MFYTVVQCEECLRIAKLAGACGITSARRLARKNGWSVGKRKDWPAEYTLCPNCRRGAKKNVK